MTLATTTNTTRSEFVALVNANVAGLTASLDGDRIIFENTDGDEIKIGSGGAEIGMTDDIYGGFVQISNIMNQMLKLKQDLLKMVMVVVLRVKNQIYLS